MVSATTWLRSSVLLLLGLASAACDSCETSGQAPVGGGDGHDSEPRPDSEVPFELPPATSGWEEARDGITCRHPAVVADCKDGWCRIPKGCFIMGSPESEWGRGLNTENQTATVLTRPFVMQQAESTRGQWEALVRVSRCLRRALPEALPATCPARPALRIRSRRGEIV
jgi:formylglycine-generating enzyme required for sulfatase activity